MSRKKIGVLHPGEMGAAVAATARNSGHEVYWVSEGRSAETRRRAAEGGLEDGETLRKLCAECDAIVSICPPEFAESLSEEVAGSGFRGLYIDANAISPQRACRMSERLSAREIIFVDGCVIGLPATKREETWLYLSGPRAREAASYFTHGPLECEVLEGGIGRASALKMCFAAHSKGVAALRAAILGTAQELGVLPELEQQLNRSGSPFASFVKSIQHTAPKAWRYLAEMEEIASTFESAGMPGEFHRAAREIYTRLAPFKGKSKPELEEALRRLKKE